MPEPCARCGAAPAEENAVLCSGCGERGPLSPDEADRFRLRTVDDLGIDPAAEPEERGFEGVGDFYSDDPYDRWIAHQAAKGRA